MNKRALCFLLAAVLILMLLPVSVLACDHCDEDGEPLKYVLKGAVSPDIGKPGYSGDYCCPQCGAVVIPGWTLPALEEPSGPAGDKEPAGKPEQTATPKTTAKPTEKPTADPTAVPKQTITSEPAPAPKQTEVPKVPDSSGKTKAPKQTAKPGKKEKPGGSKKKDPAAKTQPKQDVYHSETGTPRWEQFSRLYPYRRVMMQPAENIRAEGAGILLWPAAASPFQSIFSNP